VLNFILIIGIALALGAVHPGLGLAFVLFVLLR
jgi:hypothetical protein